MSVVTEYFDRTLYPDFHGNWDDSLFRNIILQNLKPDHYCLDYGAGRGIVKQMNFKGLAKHVAGVDPEEGIYGNPFLDEARQIALSDNKIPYDDNTFDIVFSDNVMEHIQQPGIVLAEIIRVLKPGGVFLSKTPNKWHYMAVTARLTPTWLHKHYNKLRGREAFDTFPTAYKLNSSGAVRRYARKTGFLVQDIQFFEGRPEYLRLTTVTYLFGFVYERLVNSAAMFEPFRCVMISKLVKPS